MVAVEPVVIIRESNPVSSAEAIYHREGDLFRIVEIRTPGITLRLSRARTSPAESARKHKQRIHQPIFIIRTHHTHTEDPQLRPWNLIEYNSVGFSDMPETQDLRRWMNLMP